MNQLLALATMPKADQRATLEADVAAFDGEITVCAPSNPVKKRAMKPQKSPQQSEFDKLVQEFDAAFA